MSLHALLSAVIDVHSQLWWQGVRGASRDSEDEDTPDFFDAPEAEPTEVFVNPFACSVNPLDWREVQV